jgi:hypothetical protein
MTPTERTMIIDAAAYEAEELAGDHWADPEKPQALDALTAVVASMLGDDRATAFILAAYDNAVIEYQAEWRDYDDCPLDGDHDSAMSSIGWGTDEDYGYYGEGDEYGCLGDEW